MTTTGQMKPPFQRLPTTVTPLVYKLTLQPDLTKFTFEGSQVIEIKVNQPTQVITFNANDIQIHPNGLTISYAEKVIEIAKIDYNTEQETVTLSFKEQLPVGDAKLSLKFSGNLNDKLYGFYASKYTGPDGVIRHIAVTQFEATYARWAFPCWDEPALKARFDISLIIPNDGKTLALSNMSVAFEAVVTDQLKIVHFKQTPLMSTYLVAFVVGEFDFVEGTSQDGVKVRVYTPVSKREQGIFALEMSGKALDFYKSYFNIAYPLDKMDLIAIPDFAMGAMENWGLVTYREICLLVDPLNTSTVRKQNIALTVAHELAHQWFGNLVTMEWWTDLWLNEGFASFAECLCVDKLFPQFDIWTQFVANVLLRALQLDALDSSHPIEIPVGHPSEIDEIFDAISYCKGASIIRLLHKYIGEEAFRKGMNLYLTRHSYKNAQTDHLWDALEEASKKPVRRVMTTWTKQKGFPVVLVNARPDKSNCQIVKLEQAKYTLIGDKSSSSLSASSKDKPTLWSIPLPIITETSMAKPVLYWLFETRDFNFSLKVPPTEWFKLNPSTVGFYRVSYPPELLSRFVSGIVNQSIPALDRLGLINDLQALVLAGWKSAIELFKFMTAFKGELNYVVWCALSSILDKFTQLFAGSHLAEPFRKFGLNLLTSHVFPSIGWSGKPEESYQDTMLRTLIINQLVNLEHAEVNTRCRELFQEQLQNQKAIPVDLRAAVYQSVVGHADEKTFEDMLKLHRECDLQEEQYRIASSLGHVKQECFIQDILNFAISDQVRSQDTIFVIGSIASNPVGRESAWQFFKAHREVWTPRYGSGGLISRLVKLVTENFVTEEKASEVEQFFREHKFPGTERSVQQALETIRSNAALLRRDTAVLEKFFQSQ